MNGTMWAIVIAGGVALLSYGVFDERNKELRARSSAKARARTDDFLLKEEELKRGHDPMLVMKVKQVVASSIGVPVSEVFLGSDLYRDFHAYGEDIEEVFLEYGREFQVDLTALNIAESFPDEPGIFARKQMENYKPILVADLVHAAETGTWPSDAKVYH